MSSIIGYWQAAEEIKVPAGAKTIMVGETSDFDCFLYLPHGAIDENARFLSNKSPIFIPEGATGNERIRHAYDCDVSTLISNTYAFRPKYHLEFYRELVTSSLFRAPKVYNGEIDTTGETTWNAIIPAFGRQRVVIQLDDLDASAVASIYGINISPETSLYRINEFERQAPNIIESSAATALTTLVSSGSFDGSTIAYEYENAFSAYAISMAGGYTVNIFARVED